MPRSGSSSRRSATLLALMDDKKCLDQGQRLRPHHAAGPPYADAIPFARKLVAEFGDRVVWGTDWPHPNHTHMPDDGMLVDILAEIAPSEAARQALLVDNPQRFYNFAPARKRTEPGMSGRLQDKIAIVTGAGCVGPGWGNGRATCVRFAEEGAKIFARRPRSRQRRRDGRAREGRRRRDRLQQCDVTDSASVAAMVAACLKRFGRIDVLVNNVGGSAAGGPVEMARGGLGRAGRLQPEERVPDLQARAAGDGKAEARARSSTSPRPPASAGPARRRSATPPPRPASSSSRAWWPCNMRPRASA